MALVDPAQLSEERCHLEGLGLQLTRIAGGVGLVVLALTFLVGIVSGNVQNLFFSYLVNYAFFLSITLGALGFVGIQHITRAGWSIVVRRIAEILASNIVLLLILFIPIIFGLTSLYHWTDTEHMIHDHVVSHKLPYLNVSFFLFRAVIYFAVWCGLALFYFTKSKQQDQSGEVKLSIQMETVSGLGLLFFAFTLTFASFDWFMSLDPHWYSTIYGVYYFSGSMIAIFATLSIISILLQKSGRLRRAITVEHYHDLGKFLFAFTVFWAYIAFSQYMLYWYANKPETTGWYLIRQSGQWGYIAIFLIFGHFFIPFFGLLSRKPKRRRNVLLFWAIWMLVAHWIDIYWLIMPEFSKANDSIGVIPFSIYDLGCLIGIGGLYIAAFALWARGTALTPIKDPRIGESLMFENA
ncbi:quinol:cytochrome C oxidoreductase [bacterium]|nr:quinol:cytochrome C oxidoreductase [bacterium]